MNGDINKQDLSSAIWMNDDRCRKRWRKRKIGRNGWIPGCPFPMRFSHLPPKRMDSIHSPKVSSLGVYFIFGGRECTDGWMDRYSI